MTDDINKLVDEWLPGFIPSSDLERFAAAVREAVMKENDAKIDRLIELLLHIATCGNGLNRECDRCGTLNSDLTKAAISLRAKRGVVEGET